MPSRLALIDASAAMRLRVQQYVNEDWPDVAVDFFDPNSGTLPGSDFDWGVYGVVIVGFIEEPTMALELVGHLKQSSATPPILFLASSDHQVAEMEAFLAMAKASLPRESLNRFDLRNALASLMAAHLGNPLHTSTGAITAHLRAQAAETPRDFLATGPIEAFPALQPKISVIDGAYGSRRLVSMFVRQRWPNALIEEVDPFSQTMCGAGITFAAKGDLLIVGGIGSHGEAIDALEHTRANPDSTPIILLVNSDMEDSAHELAEAGASAVLFRDSLSARDLVDAATRLIRQVDEAPPLDPVHAYLPSPRTRGTFTLTVNGKPLDVQIGRYRALGKLAGNELNQVFSAERLIDRQRAVIKVMIGMPLGDRKQLGSFIELYGYLASKEQRCIVKVLDGGITGNFPYMVFEDLGSGDLRRRVDASLAPLDALRILHQLAMALAVIHADKLAHMDLKPENVFFRDDGSVVLIDFTIATHFGSVTGMSIIGEVMGTPGYMSPEHGQGLPVDGHSDLYSIGVMFYEMLVGERPYNAESAAVLIYKHIHDEIPLLPKRLHEFQPIVDRLMAKRPEDRCQTAEELAEMASQYVQHLG
jgi:DNA-binding NarL/FixJ family response regulator